MTFRFFFPDDVTFFIGDSGNRMWGCVNTAVGKGFVSRCHFKWGHPIGQTAETGRDGLVGYAVFIAFFKGRNPTTLGKIKTLVRPNLFYTTGCNGIQGLIQGITNGDITMIAQVGILNGMTTYAIRCIEEDSARAHAFFKSRTVNKNRFEGRTRLTGCLGRTVIGTCLVFFRMTFTNHPGNRAVFVVQYNHGSLQHFTAGPAREVVVAVKVIIHVGLQILIQAGFNDIATGVELIWVFQIKGLHRLFNDIVNVASVAALVDIFIHFGNGRSFNWCFVVFFEFILADDTVCNHGIKHLFTAGISVVFVNNRRPIARILNNPSQKGRIRHGQVTGVLT